MPRVRFGRVHWLVVAPIAGLVVLGAIFAMGGESPEGVGGRFMAALGRGDVKTLTDLSYAPGKSREELERAWTYATQVAGPHYRFIFRITSTVQVDANAAAVRMQLTRNSMSPGAFEEKFELPLSREDGRWKVRVQELDRRMYPALPR